MDELAYRTDAAALDVDDVKVATMPRSGMIDIAPTPLRPFAGVAKALTTILTVQTVRRSKGMDQSICKRR
jgi:hypothetical protein